MTKYIIHYHKSVQSLNHSITQSLNPCLLILLAGCGSIPIRVPRLPPVGAVSDAEILAILERRASGVDGLYAELDVLHRDGEREGAIQAVFHFRAPGQVRMAAFKEIGFVTEPVFDLLLGASEFGIVLPAEGDGRPRGDRGPVSQFPERHPGFGGIFWARESLFLPGRGARDLQRQSEGSIRVEAPLSSGARIVWEALPGNLEVVRGRLDLPGRAPIEVEYDEYLERDGWWFPGRVRLKDPGSGIEVDVRVTSLEVNPAVPERVFDGKDVGW